MRVRRALNAGLVGTVAALLVWARTSDGQAPGTATGTAPATAPAAVAPSIEAISVETQHPLEYDTRQIIRNLRGYTNEPGTAITLQVDCPAGEVIDVSDIAALHATDDQGTDLAATAAPRNRGSQEKPYRLSADRRSIIAVIRSAAVPAARATSIHVEASITAVVGTGSRDGEAGVISLQAGQTLAIPGGTLSVAEDARRDLLMFSPSAGAEPLKTLRFAREDGTAISADVTPTVSGNLSYFAVRLAGQVGKVQVTPVLFEQVKTVHVPIDTTVTLGSVAK